MQFIDPHIHLFDRNKGHYQWLNENNQPHWPDKAIIARNFDERDLYVDSPLTLKGFVHIEAGFNNEQPWLEIEWLESHVQGPFKSVGYADITLAPIEFRRLIDRYKRYPSVVGVRHIFDGEAVELVEHPNAMTNLEYLAKAQLIFETQIDGNVFSAVDAVIKVCAENANLVVILSHGCFAPQEQEALAQWQTSMMKLAKCPLVYMKMSGWEMVNRRYDQAHISTVISSVIKSFGHKRVMLASNFPLILFSQPYQSLWHDYQSLELGTELLAALCYNNAASVYGFKDLHRDKL
ncbi:amidohydrolase family protein [Psychrobium sp. nBUS_13]|uniref:amidohydrolase family protein n=1 Tax=Psychrobium sp. nBUS_13 TaxID=3395319 RepID=UPI003EBA694E